MPLFARSFEELMGDSIEDLATNTNITKLSAGGKARAILEAVNKRIEEQYDIFDLNLARAFISAAPGQFLDLIGSLLALPREVSVAASISAETEVVKWYVDSGTFGDINGGEDMFIPAGTTISTGASSGGILYRTTSDMILDANRSSTYLSAEAAVPGEDSNLGTGSLIYHTFTGYTDYLNNTLKIRNIHPVANGKSFENDANYRFRIANRVLEVEAANQTAIRLAALSTPGVADVIQIPRYRGIGTFGLIIQSVTPTVSDALIDSVTANVYNTQAFGELAFIRAPKETGFTMRTTIHYSNRLTTEELDDIELLLIDTITNYVNELDIGDDLLINRLVSELFGIDDNIANFGTTGVPIEEMYIHKESALGDNKVRQKLLGDYSPASDERVIIEPSVTNQITFVRSFTGR